MKPAAKELKLDEKTFLTILDDLQEGVYFVDRERTITYWSRSAERITGFKASEVVGTRCMENVLNHVDDSGRQLCLENCPLVKSMRSGRECEEHVYFQHREGHRIPVFVRVRPMRDAQGRIIGAVETFTDTSAHVANIEKINQLEEMALVDPLTRLGNRRCTEETITRRLEELRRYGWPFALLFMDIDSFKMINDAFGHETGDEALRMTAVTIRKSLRPFDYAGRWGGDEFVVLLVNVSGRGLRAAAERIRLLVARSNVRRFENPLWVTVSIGAAQARPGDTAAALLKRADELMYESKERGKNRDTMDEGWDAAAPAPGTAAEKGQEQ